MSGDMPPANSEDPEGTPKRKMPVGRPFQKGQSGNPSGVPKSSLDLRTLARAHTARAIETLAECMENRDGRVRVAASEALLNRAWGKPVQPVEGTDGPPVRIDAEAARSELAGLLARIAARVGAGDDTK